MNIDLGNFMANLSTSTQGVFDSMLPVIYLLAGMLVAFWVISVVIDLLHQSNQNGTITGRESFDNSRSEEGY